MKAKKGEIYGKDRWGGSEGSDGEGVSRGGVGRGRKSRDVWGMPVGKRDKREGDGGIEDRGDEGIDDRGMKLSMIQV